MHVIFNLVVKRSRSFAKISAGFHRKHYDILCAESYFKCSFAKMVNTYQKVSTGNALLKNPILVIFPKLMKVNVFFKRIYCNAKSN